MKFGGRFQNGKFGSRFSHKFHARRAISGGAVGDIEPDAFTFVDQTNVNSASTITSAAVTIGGIASPSPISITGGTYSINGGAYTSTAGTVMNGDSVTVRHTSAATLNTATNTVLTIGGVSDTFTSTTHAPVLAWRASDLSLAPYIGSGTPTVARASNTATVINSSGLIATVNANLARYDYNLAGVLQGLLVEPAATNVLLNTRDKTNASWVKGATMTAAKDQTGIDGSANTASSLTGGAVTATNTCLQTVVLASSSRVYSAYVKRLVGTGTIEMTTDGGTSWVVVTSQISASWARVSIPAQTVTNPSSGFRITTSGDKIAVDYDQNETGVLTSPTVAPTAAAVTRNADDITLATSSISGFSSAITSVYVRAIPGGYFGAPQFITISDGTVQNFIDFYRTSSTAVQGDVASGNLNQAMLAPAGTVASNTTNKIMVTATINDFAACVNGGAVATDVSGSMPVSPTTMQIGGFPGQPAQYLNGWITDIELYATRVDNAGMQNKTT